jgi:branched-subunit amino acid aminotransferase/4-amino-4-deoxychorismate lyase
MLENTFTTGFNNGRFTQIEQIITPIDCLTVNRGYAAYEFLRIKNGKPFFFDRHMARLIKTLEIMRLTIPFGLKEIETSVAELSEKNNMQNGYLKFFAIPSSSSQLLNPADFYIIPFHGSEYPDETYQTGSNLIMKEYARFLPEAKTTNYVASAYWQYEMDQKKAIDVLYFSGNEVFETSRGNLFIARGNEIYTPDRQILKGITRSIVSDLAKRFKISEQAISVRDLFWADEVFITSTTKKIMPIVQINNAEIGKGVPGPVSIALLEMYNELLIRH